MSRNLLGALALIVLGLLAWQLRWVLLILFGAVTLGVALDVPTTLLMRRFRLGRAPALLLVLALLVGVGFALSQVLVPELAEQVNQLRLLAPEVAKRLAELGRKALPTAPCRCS